ncbi:hypothetical protein CDAR_617642 [Caerostris darwini]|uniref:Uncharacterized protein n=1 Tax=Caerostris darwini TaxID=1538125 RepID=A0AAV4T6C5_9ARAC|nr:hypothetical protein CDAR_617642 [Caerostris darwini]
MLNGTPKMNEQQQSAVEELELKVYRLNMKVQLLEAGQNDILKRVLELHGFFLVLEIIIMSTIFSIFFNKFKRNEYYIK